MFTASLKPFLSRKRSPFCLCLYGPYLHYINLLISDIHIGTLVFILDMLQIKSLWLVSFFNVLAAFI